MTKFKLKSKLKPKPKSQKIKKTKLQIANKLLNIVIIIMGILWFAIWYFRPNELSLYQQAEIEFQEANILFYEKTIKANVPAIKLNDFKTIISSSQEKPLFIMIYASWCPYCKIMFNQLNEAALNYGDKIRIVTISIDKNIANADKFAQVINKIYLDNVVIANNEEYYKISKEIRNIGLQFNRDLYKEGSVFHFGRTKIPYSMLFLNGEAVEDFIGALPEEKLEEILLRMLEYKL